MPIRQSSSNGAARERFGDPAQESSKTQNIAPSEVLRWISDLRCAYRALGRGREIKKTRRQHKARRRVATYFPVHFAR
jgi:hypothetical protein